jgi:patatin-like phospholipase/acyl hydrolase
MNALMKQYCSYKDLKDLYGKVVLPVDQMQKNMHEFTKEHE